MDETKFTVQVTDARNALVKGTSVTIDLNMPGMDMGENIVPMKPLKAGVYRGSGRFMMPGRWQATVTAVKGTETTRRSFPVTVQ